MQQYPITNPAAALVFAHTAAEGQRIPVLSDEQQQVVEGIHRLQVEAAANPAYNGQAARKAVRP